MNRNDLFKSFSEIDDEVLLRAECAVAHRTHKHIGIMAACLALVLCVFGVAFLCKSDNQGGNGSSLFVITAYAADGELKELGLHDGCFNSGGTGTLLFPADAPLFTFAVKPSNWDENQALYANLSITISYDGKTVTSKDDHVVVTHLIPVPGSDAPYEYEIMGWFEEKTDVTVSIFDKNSGELIEEITVNICYSADSQAYRLTVIDVKTNEDVK